MWERKRVRDPLVRLQTSLKGLTRSVASKQVHDLRTSIRRTQCVVHALDLSDSREGQRILRETQQLHKLAGKVRDMDVLAALADPIKRDCDEKCMATLLDELVSRRIRAARNLQAEAGRLEPQLSRDLKKCFEHVDEKLRELNADEREEGSKRTFPAERLVQEFASQPKLTAGNLHDYRKQVKMLRDRLTLAGSTDTRLDDDLRRVKDSIGIWHDWSQLAKIAKTASRHSANRTLRTRIEAIVDDRLRVAMHNAYALQKRFRKTKRRAAETSGGAKISRHCNPSRSSGSRSPATDSNLRPERAKMRKSM